jgi:tetratricopeptide (TPR) repeat protein
LYAESILLFEGCLPTEPKNSTLAYFLGLSYQYSGELEKAKIELERVVNLDKDFVKEAQKGLISLQKQIALKAKEKPPEVEPVQ